MQDSGVKSYEGLNDSVACMADLVMIFSGKNVSLRRVALISCLLLLLLASMMIFLLATHTHMDLLKLSRTSVCAPKSNLECLLQSNEDRYEGSLVLPVARALA